MEYVVWYRKNEKMFTDSFPNTITQADNYDKRVYPLLLKSLAYSKIYAISIVYL
jgi:hypothetical protein